MMMQHFLSAAYDPETVLYWGIKVGWKLEHTHLAGMLKDNTTNQGKESGFSKIFNKVKRTQPYNRVLGKIITFY